MIVPENNLSELADSYLHGLLSYEDALAFKQACEVSAEHRAALADAELRLQALQALPAVHVSEELIHAAMNRAVGPAALVFGNFAKVFWSTCAAAALLFAVVHLYFATLTPSSTNLVVLGQSVWLPDSLASLRVRLTNHNTGAALASIPVTVAVFNVQSQESVTLSSFETDDQGSGQPQLKLPDWPDGDYQLRVTAQIGRRQEVVEKPIALRRKWKVMLSSDKPVYQPGQTIHLRSLALRKPDLKPQAGNKATFTLTDPKGNVLFKQETITSKFGIAAADCPTAQEIQHGAYTITCLVGETSSQQTVEIKPYTLPKFKLELIAEQPYYQPGDLVKVKVAAHYFFGKPVAAAVVGLDVQTTEVEPRSLEFLSAKTNADGQAELEFRLPEQMFGTERLEGDAELRLQVTMTDAGGQCEQREQSLLVTSQPIRIEVIPEGGSLVPDVPNKIYVFTSYADGRPAKTRIAISGHSEELQTNEYGVATFVLKSDDLPRDGLLLFSATDEAGVRAGQVRVSLAASYQPGDFIVRTDKSVYDGGETVRVSLLGGGIEPIFVDVLKDRQTLLTQSVSMQNPPGELVIDLSPELTGTLQLCAYRMQPNGMPLRKMRVIYVRPAQSLTIETKFDQPEYRPGQKAKLQFTLKDQQGQPQPGALSLSAVDEAVYSVLAQRPGMESTYFQLEQELLRPVYALYAWNPGAPGRPFDAQLNELEQALFIRASESAGQRDEALRNIIEQYGDRDFRMLDVLEREDWEILAADAGISEGTLSLLRGENSPHSLSVATFPQKEAAVLAQQRTWGERMVGAWWILGIVAGIGGLVALIRVLADGCGTAIVVVVLGSVLMSLMLPAVQSAREASRRSQAMNDLKNLDLAAGLSQEAHSHADHAETTSADSAAPPRVRQWFPETLLWRPELITNDQGEATLELDLADSITNWKLGISAVSAGGQLGGAESALRVFQPFFVELNLPVALTRGDEVALPVVVYNYLDRPQQVKLTLAQADWFELQGGAEQTLELGPQEVRSVAYRLKARQVGEHAVQVTALGSEVSDAIRRTLAVVPDGRPVEQTQSGTLAAPAEFATHVPNQAIEGSVRTLVTIYPSSFSQVVEGLDGIFQRPYGCFEQTSSTTYPNILALDYLRLTKQNMPAVEAKASQYIHLGYQRLVGFEVAGGGFDWFGSPPANRTLTAYGLMEFQDMARVHDVDPALIERTRQWLLGQQRLDGSWIPEAHALHDDPTRREAPDLAQLTTTAYIAWAVYADPQVMERRGLALQFVLNHDAETIDSPYALALVAQALGVLDPQGKSAEPYLNRLLAMKKTDAQGKFCWWEPASSAQTVFYGAGHSGQIETTALALLALQEAKREPETIRRGLSWLITQKDEQGTWYTTSSTVLALKALLAGTGKPLGDKKPRTIAITVDGKPVEKIVIPADQAEVTRQINLTTQTAQGAHRIRLVDESGTDVGYQIVFRYYEPEPVEVPELGPLSIKLDYDRLDASVGGDIRVTAGVTNQLQVSAPMVLLDLPIPAGFALETRSLDQAVANGSIARYQTTSRSLLVYLRELEPQRTVALEYQLRATMPITTKVRPPLAYHYYDPAQRGTGAWVNLQVSEVAKP